MLNRFSQLDQDEVWLSSIVAAELRFGVAKLSSPRFSAAVEATHHYAQIRCELEKIGRPIGGMDLMIASHAQSEQSTLITNNAQEFCRIPTLTVEEWKL